MKTLRTDKKIDYDGSQLSPHWILRNFEITGNAVVAFEGKCHVPTENLVDLHDQREKKTIFSESMLHLIAEFFDRSLDETILLQRLLVSLAQQEIVFRSKTPTLIRAGNDLFDGEAKLSVSVATASPVSTLLHFGINISSKNTPVKTKGLEDYRISPPEFAQSLLETFRHEVESVKTARAKVRPVFPSDNPPARIP